MKGLNWLIKLLTYKHTEHDATLENTSSQDENALFFDVGFIDQCHANLCTDASMSMIDHFYGNPISTMAINPRGFLEGCSAANEDDENLEEEEKSRFDAHYINTQNELTWLLKNNGPLILALPLKYNAAHSVVIHGTVENNIIYHDPLTGANKKIPFGDLQKLHYDPNSPMPFSILLASLKKSERNNIDPKDLSQFQLNENPENLAIEKYQQYFTIEKMQDPCQAIKDFLYAYTQTHFWQRSRPYQKKMQHFLESTKEITKLSEFMQRLEKKFGYETTNDDSLNRRLQTIYKVLNMQYKIEHTRPNTPESDFETADDIKPSNQNL